MRQAALPLSNAYAFGFIIYFILVICVTRIYAVRHCETDGNARKIFQGHIDLDINELGVKQLAALGERFKTVKLDKIYTSPLIRAQKTAQAVKGKGAAPIIADEGLIELSGGVYEGMEFSQIGAKYPDFPDIWANHPWDFAPEKGERMTDAYDRIWNIFLRIVKENTGKNIAVITHGGVIRCLLCRLLRNDIKKMNDIPFGCNTAVNLFEIDDNMNVNVIYFNNSAHLVGDLKNINAEVPR